MTPYADYKPLWTAFFCGMSIAASWAVLFSGIGFSIFPLLALLYSAVYLYQSYMTGFLKTSTGLCVWLFGLAGLFGYQAVLRVFHPELGNNLFQVLLGMGLVIFALIKQYQEQQTSTQT